MTRRVMAVGITVIAVLTATTTAGSRSGVSNPCRLGQFQARVGTYVGEATEQHTLAVRLINRSRQSCILDGYPRLTLRDDHGALPVRITYRGDEMIAKRAPLPVRVLAGQFAFFVLNKNVCVRGPVRTATSLKVSAADAGSAVLTFPKRMPQPYRIPDLCRYASDPGRLVAVSPFVPTVQAALAVP